MDVEKFSQPQDLFFQKDDLLIGLFLSPFCHAKKLLHLLFDDPALLQLPLVMIELLMQDLDQSSLVADDLLLIVGDTLWGAVWSLLAIMLSCAILDTGDAQRLDDLLARCILTFSISPFSDSYFNLLMVQIDL